LPVGREIGGCLLALPDIVQSSSLELIVKRNLVFRLK
jgi:hypothetical protein